MVGGGGGGGGEVCCQQQESMTPARQRSKQRSIINPTRSLSGQRFFYKELLITSTENSNTYTDFIDERA